MHTLKDAETASFFIFQEVYMNIFKKILIAIIIFSVICLNGFPVRADSVGDPNIDSGGGGMGSGTSQNFWSPSNDGVRITVVDSESGQPQAASVDYTNIDAKKRSNLPRLIMTLIIFMSVSPKFIKSTNI